MNSGAGTGNALKRVEPRMDSSAEAGKAFISAAANKFAR
jgi:hypothetical protein